MADKRVIERPTTTGDRAMSKFQKTETFYTSDGELYCIVEVAKSARKAKYLAENVINGARLWFTEAEIAQDLDNLN
jgi:hypothetical protein